MATLREIEKQILVLEAELSDRREARNTKLPDKMLRCAACKRSTAIRKLTFIQCWWYEQPYGCTGGDSWHPTDAIVHCIKCGGRSVVTKKSVYYPLRRYFGRELSQHGSRVTLSRVVKDFVYPRPDFSGAPSPLPMVFTKVKYVDIPKT